jgi:hypothetical protein
MVMHEPRSSPCEARAMKQVNQSPGSSPRVVYALTTNGRDFYSATTRVSVEAIRISNPSLRVVVACDAVSGRALKSSCDPLLNEIDELVICDTPEGNAGYRSRHVKTRLREIIDGPFLFLDSDTFVRGDVSPIFSLDADIAAACNNSRDEFSEQVYEADAQIIALMKWQVGGLVFLNSGVLFYNETPGARRFGSLWHQKWLDSAEALTGGLPLPPGLKLRKVHRDQPALHAALYEAQPRLSILPHKFNAQFKVTPRVVENAVIWHFYSSGSRVALTSFESLVERVLRGERLCGNTVAEMIQRPHPWRCNSWLDDWIASRLARSRQVDAGYRAWFQGRRVRACRYWTVPALKSCLSPRAISLAQAARRRLRRPLHIASADLIAE